MKHMKRIFAIILTIVLTSTIAVISVSAAVDYDNSVYYEKYRELLALPSAKEPVYQGNCAIYIHDHANLIGDTMESQILEAVKKEVNGSIDGFLVLTYGNSFGTTARIFTDDYVDILFRLDVNSKETIVAVCLDMDNREVYINTTGKAIKTFDEDTIDDCLDAGWNSIVSENYADGILKITKATADVATQNVFSRYFGSDMFMYGIIIGLVAAGIAIFVAWQIHNKNNRETSADKYISKQETSFQDESVRLVNTTTRVHSGYYKSSSGGGGGGSHSSHSGSSHGGGGRSF